MPVLVSFCPEDDTASHGAITVFVADVVEEYAASFDEVLEPITVREPPPWGQRDRWGESIQAGAPIVAMVTPAFSRDTDRVAEAVGLSGGDVADPTGRVVLLPWERIDEPTEGAIPTLSRIAPDSEQYAEAVRGVAYWVRGVIETITANRPAAVELSHHDTHVTERGVAGQELAFAARQYSRLSAQILHNGTILDVVSAAIFDGLESVLGSRWDLLDAPGVCDLAVDLSPRVAESKIASRTMVRSWKEALRVLRRMYRLAEDADYHPFRDHIKVMLWDLAEALDVRVDAQTLTELQFGAATQGELRPAFRALLRNAHARQRVRAGALYCLAYIGEEVPEPDEYSNPDALRRPKRGKGHRKGASAPGASSHAPDAPSE
ncbi:MAG: hypothetical protein LBK59_10905 [Bifidobacteriaceae bacterium]|jgi:hypothetical protein|nr:hypothetical protein [Bifidobacteriaceae bacterium]